MQNLYWGDAKTWMGVAKKLYTPNVEGLRERAGYPHYPMN